MKIEKIILKNFSAVMIAMKTNEIEIDFSNAINKICLIIGPNGSGKTTLLSLLNPFAGLGNLDIRDGINLILENKDGYKEIHIRDDENYYIIKHFYTAHKDKNHSVKSYISKNDVELNVNGNVTSFKEYIKEELGLETDYLRLIRLGSNVSSLISLSETERKAYMSKLLDDIGIFLTYYKKINNDIHQLKEMISHDVDKLNRLGIDDKQTIKKEISKLKSQLENAQEEYGKLSGLLSIYNHEISSIEDAYTLKDRLSDAIKKLNKMDKILERKDDYESTSSEYYSDKINEIEKELIVYSTQINSANILIENRLTHLNSLEEQLHTLEIQIEKEEASDKNIQGLMEEYKKNALIIQACKENLTDYHPEYTKKEISDFFIFLKNSQQVLSKTYEFGKGPIRKIISLMKDNRNVMQYINTHIMDLDDSGDNQFLFLRTISQRFNFDQDHKFEGCVNTECMARQLWVQVKNLLETNEVLHSEKHDISFYKDMEYAYQNIKTVILSFSEYKSLIDRLPEKIKKSFLINSIYKSISNLEYIYDEKEMNELFALITEYEDYMNLISVNSDIQKDINNLQKNSSTEYLKEQRVHTKNQIQEIKDIIRETKEDIINIKEKQKEKQNTLETYRELKETFEMHDDLAENVSILSSQYEIYTKNKSLVHSTELDIQKVKMNIDLFTKKIQELTSKLDQFILLKEELNKFNEKYDEMTLIKEALSSKKGMPLYYIKSYLGNTEEITNELLDIAYDGNIYIDNFKITPTEFTIPFYNKGNLIKDIKYASQGELSFLSVALSFGLASQALSKYNIMLLDEIDGPLDTKNREKFIRILENQIDRIGSEQSFLITHNDMFSSYPVDIIDLGFSNQSDNKYELANFIDVKRK